MLQFSIIYFFQLNGVGKENKRLCMPMSYKIRTELNLNNKKVSRKQVPTHFYYIEYNSILYG